MKRYISLVLVVLIALVCFSSCEKKASTVQEMQEASEQAITSKATDFKGAYKNLVSQLGELKEEQDGVMMSADGVWLEPSGIIAHKIADFDSDGADEMLVVYTKENKDGYAGDIQNDIYFDMYENEDGEIKSVDTMQFVSYHENRDEFAGVYLKKAQDIEVYAKVSIVNTDSVYLLCQSRMIGAWGNGQSQDLWLVEYKNNKFNYKASLTQTAGGSSEFEYTSYSFVNGELDDAFVLYNEMYMQEFEGANEPLYTSYGKAVSEFLKSVYLTADDDIRNANNPFEESVDFFDSFVEEDGKEVFELKNEVKKREFSEDSSKMTVKFEFEIDRD